MAARTETISLGYSPRKWQEKVHRSLRRFNVLVVHRRGGKTVMALAELIDKALREGRQRGRYGYVGPILKQAKKVSWSYLKDFVSDIPGVKINESELYIEFPNNGARITIYGADNPDSIRGEYFDGVVLDEYADIHPELWSKVIRPMLADRKGWAIFIGTPKGHDQFFEILKLAKERMNEGKAWFATVLPHWETGVLDRRELDDALEEMGENAFAQEFCCDFSVEAADSLIPIALVQAAMGKHLKKTDYELAAKIMGVDVARFGDDSSVIAKRQGLYVHKPIALKGLDNMEVADRVAFEINQWKPDAVFIDAGRGEGVIDRLRQLGYHVVEANFGGRTFYPRASFKAEEMYLKLKQGLKDGMALPDDTSLMTELTARKYEFTSSGLIKLESKKKMKERYKSPDKADAVALTFYQDVQPQIDTLDNLPQDGMSKEDLEYDPY